VNGFAASTASASFFRYPFLSWCDFEDPKAIALSLLVSRESKRPAMDWKSLFELK
jgi:hypothetical protein